MSSVVGTELPLFSIQTTEAILQELNVDTPKVLGSFSISSGSTTVSGDLGIEIRGASSKYFPKKGYGFETRDLDGHDVDVSLLGLPAEEDWILNGPYSDKTLIRNVLIYNISREMGHYATRTRFVDLNLNGENQGIYVLMEKQKRDPERINIAKNKDGITGYILKINRPDYDIVDGNRTFTSNNSFESVFGSDIIPDHKTRALNILYDYPKEEDITVNQKTYISNYVNEFEIALASPTFKHPTNGKGYGEYIDVDSFIDYMIMQEISNNGDGYRMSTFMHKDVLGKLKMGPVWDFNLAFGNFVDMYECGADLTNGWHYYMHTVCPSIYPIPFWFPRLVQDVAFVSRFEERWTGFRQNVLSTEKIFETIDGYVEEISGSIVNNFSKWDILGKYVWPNSFVGKTYEDEIKFLKDWISERLTWMDKTIEAGDMTLEPLDPFPYYSPSTSYSSSSSSTTSSSSSSSSPTSSPTVVDTSSSTVIKSSTWNFVILGSSILYFLNN